MTRTRRDHGDHGKGVSGKDVEELRRRKRGRDNEARMVAIYLGRHLGGHRHEDIGKAVGLDKTSSVSSAYLLMKGRVAKEKRLVRRVRRIEEALTAKGGLDPFICSPQCVEFRVTIAMPNPSV